jgi:Zn-dependent peptidase ImmA (M78 family)
MIVDWPVLSDDEIERLAHDFRSQALEGLALNSCGAVPVEQIAEQYLGYELEFVGDDGALPGDVIGGIDFDANTIIINSSIESHLGRYSFTIAHEIAHHVLHRDLFLKARSGASIMCRGGKKRPIEEVQADRFAEALLMPLSTIVNSCEKANGLIRYSRRRRLSLAAKAIKLTGLNNVSVSAMEMRLMHLGLLPSYNSNIRRTLKAILARIGAS